MNRQDAIYARQSVEKKDSLSISGQVDLCRRMAGEKEPAVYRDAGYSGKNTERPAFRQLMQDVKAGRIATLYVYRLDRFSRSVADFGQLWQVLQANRVEFVSVSENFDTSTPMGRAMLHIIMVFAQLERETIAQRVRDNYYRRAALGTWPGGPAPFGFDNGRVAGRDGRRAPALVPNGRGELVRRIFAEYAGEGTSLSVLNSPGLVEAELFLRCQEKLRKNRQLGRSGQGKHTWLSGLLKCAECGYSVSVTENGGRRYLHCSGRYNLAHCRSAIRVDLAELEERVQGDISKLLADCPKPRAESGESRYAASMTKLDRQAERLTDAFAQSESMPTDYLRRALGKIQRQRQTLQQERDRAQRRGEETREMEFAALTFAEKKAVAAQLIACIRLAGDTVEIRWAV